MLLLGCASTGVACDTVIPIAVRDAGSDVAPPRPDGGSVCASSCDDGIFCNGVEQCDPVRGCVAASIGACDDGDPCTVNSCDETARTCSAEPRDVDGDGSVDDGCSGGTDCDDLDPNINPLAEERCGTLIDEDCDLATDEAGCALAMGSTCAMPFVISGPAPSTTHLEAVTAPITATGVSTGSCPPNDFFYGAERPNFSSTVVALSLATTTRVTFEATSISATAGVPPPVMSLSRRSDCGELTALSCVVSTPATGNRGRIDVVLPPGSHSFVILTSLPTPIEIDVSTSADVAPPSNDSCAAPLLISSGDRLIGNFTTATDDLLLECRVDRASADTTYRVEVSEISDVEVVLRGGSASGYTASLRTACDDASTSVRCASDASVFPGFEQVASLRARSVAPGTYFLVLEGPEGAFQADVTVSPPSAPIPGDTCDTAITLVPGETRTDDRAGAAVDLESECRPTLPPSAGDLIYRLDLPSRSDVELEFASGVASQVRAELTPTCGGPVVLSPVCTSGEELSMGAASYRTFLRRRAVDPGTYFLIVDSDTVGSHTLSTRVTPPASPLVVTGNETCASAHPIPPEGGYFEGTAAMNDITYSIVPPYFCDSSRQNEVAFRLELTERQRVVIAATSLTDQPASFDVFAGSCAATSVVRCAYDRSAGVLDPGLYYVVVNAEAGYRLDISVEAP